LVVAAAGSVDHQELIKLVEQGLATAGWDLGLQAKPVPRRLLNPAKISRGSKLNVIHRPISQVNIMVGSEGLYVDDPRRYAMGVLNTVLGGGMSSRLFQEIREKRGLAYSVYSFNQGYSDAATFGLYAGCSPAKAKEVTELMIAELDKVAQSGITSEELALARGNISGSLALKFETNQARMSRLASAEIVAGEFMDLDETIERFAAVELSQVQALAQDLLKLPRSIVAVGDVSETMFESFVR
jgi:predicted Zn-dependent peptidase